MKSIAGGWNGGATAQRGQVWAYSLVAVGFLLVAAATATPWVREGTFAYDAFDSYSEFANLVLLIGASGAGLCLRSRAKLWRIGGWAAAVGASLVIAVVSIRAIIDPDSVLNHSGGFFHIETTVGPGPILAVAGVVVALSGLVVFARAGSTD